MPTTADDDDDAVEQKTLAAHAGGQASLDDIPELRDLTDIEAEGQIRLLGATINVSRSSGVQVWDSIDDDQAERMARIAGVDA